MSYTQSYMQFTMGNRYPLSSERKLPSCPDSIECHRPPSPPLPAPSAVLTYVENHNLQPGTSYWMDTWPYNNIVANLNALYLKSFTRISFRLQQVGGRAGGGGGACGR